MPDIAALLVLALLLDALVGDPSWLWSRAPHPVALMGRLIGGMDRRFNEGAHRHLAGICALLILVGVVGAMSILPRLLPYGWVLEVALAAALMAHRSLVQHVADVAAALGQGLAPGRVAVSRIVGRDPEALDEAGVARAAIESAAENFSDGVVAPAFWFAVAGLPGIAIYKAVNTADSMIGHRTERHREFGWASARLDDVLNLVPARLAGALLCLVGSGRAAFRVMLRDAGQHRSPNAGWPEAAMAASLGVALAGPRVYRGQGTVGDPYMNREGRRAATRDDVERAIGLLWRAWLVLVALAGALALAGMALRSW